MDVVQWKIIPFSILWSIWKERNDRIFSRKKPSWESHISGVATRIAKWAGIRKECSDQNVENFLQNWDDCLKMGASKKKKKVPWCCPPFGTLEFNVDGAARGKPELVGVGEVLRN